MSQSPKTAGFLISVLVHAAVLGAILLFGAIPAGGCRTRQPTLEIPIGFLVEEAPGVEPAPQEPAPPEPTPPEPTPPEPEPEPDVPAPPPPKPEPEKKPDPPPKKPTHVVKKSDTIIKREKPTPTTRKPPQPPPGKKLSADDIRKMTSTPRVGVPGGSPTGSPNAQANEDNLAIARIQTTLYNAWVPPTYEDRGSRPVSLLFEFRLDGSFNVSLSESSGSTVMDRSILDAARGVRRFSFLTHDFIRRYPSIVIDFKLNSAP